MLSKFPSPLFVLAFRHSFNTVCSSRGPATDGGPWNGGADVSLWARLISRGQGGTDWTSPIVLVSQDVDACRAGTWNPNRHSLALLNRNDWIQFTESKQSFVPLLFGLSKHPQPTQSWPPSWSSQKRSVQLIMTLSAHRPTKERHGRPRSVRLTSISKHCASINTQPNSSVMW